MPWYPMIHSRVVVRQNSCLLPPPVPHWHLFVWLSWVRDNLLSGEPSGIMWCVTWCVVGRWRRSARVLCFEPGKNVWTHYSGLWKRGKSFMERKMIQWRAWQVGKRNLAQNSLPWAANWNRCIRAVSAARIYMFYFQLGGSPTLFQPRESDNNFYRERRFFPSHTKRGWKQPQQQQTNNKKTMRTWRKTKEDSQEKQKRQILNKRL